MSDHIAFLPNLQESIMDELRTTEGMIFRDESAKKLFLDTKSLVLDTFFAAWKTFDAETYQSTLDAYISWGTATEEEESKRAVSGCKDFADRLASVTVLYAKYLYAGMKESIQIRKPKLEQLLKGMYTRFSRMHHIRNGSFFDLDPLKQDFIARDAFRQTLGSDCIKIIEVDNTVVINEEKNLESLNELETLETLKTLETLESETPQQTQQEHEEDSDVHRKDLNFDNKETAKLHKEESKEDEIYPDDSISRVMERRAAYSVAESVVSKAVSRVSEFKMPKEVRRVHISDQEDN